MDLYGPDGIVTGITQSSTITKMIFGGRKQGLKGPPGQPGPEGLSGWIKRGGNASAVK